MKYSSYMHYTSPKRLKMSNIPNTNELKSFIIDFGLLVKKLRLEGKHKQATLSEEIGISTRQLSDIENGKATCRLDTLYKICNAFGLSIDIFFSKLKESGK